MLDEPLTIGSSDRLDAVTPGMAAIRRSISSKSATRACFTYRRARRVEPEQRDLLGPEAERHGSQIRERAQEQARADQEQHRQAHLRDDERAPAHGMRGVRHRASAILQRRVHVDAPRLQDRREAEQDASSQWSPP